MSSYLEEPPMRQVLKEEVESESKDFIYRRIRQMDIRLRTLGKDIATVLNEEVESESKDFIYWRIRQMISDNAPYRHSRRGYHHPLELQKSRDLSSSPARKPEIWSDEE
jgi:predicted RNA-binding protein